MEFGSIDDFLEIISSIHQSCGQKESVSVINPLRYNDMKKAYTMISESIPHDAKGYDVSYDIRSDMLDGVITLRCDRLCTTEVKDLIKAMRLSSSWDVDPTNDNRIRINFYFSDLMVQARNVHE